MLYYSTTFVMGKNQLEYPITKKTSPKNKSSIPLTCSNLASKAVSCYFILRVDSSPSLLKQVA